MLASCRPCYSEPYSGAALVVGHRPVPTGCLCPRIGKLSAGASGRGLVQRRKRELCRMWTFLVAALRGCRHGKTRLRFPCGSLRLSSDIGHFRSSFRGCPRRRGPVAESQRAASRGRYELPHTKQTCVPLVFPRCCAGIRCDDAPP